jgi:FkbM family methyltransferase
VTTAKAIEDRNRATLAAIAEECPGIDWLSHPFIGLYTVDLPDIDPFVMFSANDCHIVRAFIWEQKYEDLSTRLWGERARNAKVVLDIGANTGVYSLIAASANQQATIFAFEPLPDALARLDVNVAANGFSNIKSYGYAIANASGNVALELTGKSYRLINTGGRIRSEKSEPGKGVARIRVKTIKIDDFSDAFHANGRVLIKIDVEGGEEAVLLGATGFVRDHRPDILMEVLDHDHRERRFTFLRPYGYKLFRILESIGRVVPETESEEFPSELEDWNWFATVDPRFDPSDYVFETG